LNASAGARTPMSVAITMAVILIALRFLTRTFQYIPQPSLSAVIFAAVWNLISLSDFWHAWKHSKKDFFTMLTTAVITFVFDTSVGLAVGIACSVLVYLSDVAFNKANAPEVLVAKEINNGVDVLKLNGDLNFLTSARFKDFFNTRIILEDVPNAEDTIGDRLFKTISGAFDYALIPVKEVRVTQLPKAIALDMTAVRVIDLNGLEEIAESARAARIRGIKFVAFNIFVKEISDSITKYGVFNDQSTDDVDLSQYINQSTLLLGELAQAVVPINEDNDHIKVDDQPQHGSYEMVNTGREVNEV